MINKNLLLFIILLISISFFSCSDKSSSDSNPVGAIGGGNGAGNNVVTFTIGSSQDQQGDVTFNATPSVAVKITKVTVALPAQQFTDPLQGDGTTVYPANQPVQLEVYSGVASGQQWTFQFEGTISSNNQTFSVTTNYTIP